VGWTMETTSTSMPAEGAHQRGLGGAAARREPKARLRVFDHRGTQGLDQRVAYDVTAPSRAIEQTGCPDPRRAAAASASSSQNAAATSSPTRHPRRDRRSRPSSARSLGTAGARSCLRARADRRRSAARRARPSSPRAV